MAAIWTRAHQQRGLTLGRTASLLTSPSGLRLLASSRLISRRSQAAIPSILSSHPAPPNRLLFDSSREQARQLRALHNSVRLLQKQPQDDSGPPSEKGQDKAAEAKGRKPAAEEAAEDELDGDKRKKDAGEGEEGSEGAKEGSKEDGDKKKQAGDMPPPPRHGDKTPWQVFMETMQSEFKQSKEWDESTKAIASSAHQFTESESVRRARQAYEATSGAVSNTAGTVLKGTASAIGKGASWTWETPVMKGVRKAANVTGDALDEATKPIRETEAFKDVKNVIDDGSSSRYGGWVDKEERRRRRELQQADPSQAGPVAQENTEAGTNVTLHKDAAWKEAWRDFRDSNKFVQGVFSMKSTYQESENPLISTARSITDRVAGFFAENETAMVIKKLRQMDPAFQIEPFLRDLREYILPEVLDAYVKGDVETLKLWLSEAQFSVYEALTKQYLQVGLKSDGRILDIRHVDILKARMLEPGEIPVFIITCRTQEVHVYRNSKTKELAAGMEDRVQLVTYAIGITRVPEDVNNPETRGWRLIEMQKSSRDYI
ncbi:mitochondrial inner membrane translocase subunit TIM44 [Gaeumannomyces tritici R3-111a-1]|uniref:Mitochondrial import inner membrane translocase subunit TIM44 n=1 Tax=Gaeumannomyces tritici (strain R3-111a-1) TaxID=644352 RepID=J3PH62_GAET3|nr:mitochondrial inner membrane translocase subunit TIM44 [Gaeumannomyces tritici R3-111a-1]EJT69222.1 mitochondrial inner membrane translocase subunit TIM44 [Gaeumannomyces tritici R3-111a-1]